MAAHRSFMSLPVSDHAVPLTFTQSGSASQITTVHVSSFIRKQIILKRQEKNLRDVTTHKYYLLKSVKMDRTTHVVLG